MDEMWGIVRYQPTGSVPEDDKCCFDGWYSDFKIAKAIYIDWRVRYSHWNVAVVRANDAHFGWNH